MDDLMTFVVLGGLCLLFYWLANWGAANIQPDDTYDIRGYRKKPFSKEDLDYLHRACLGKSKKEQRQIIRNFRGLPWD
ncbi:MAG: hypothetical protein IJB85_12780 [Clostridia bacterium]|nr:hypothetical protein [Clostridia bacterium]